jgi:hypothetical protein
MAALAVVLQDRKDFFVKSRRPSRCLAQGGNGSQEKPGEEDYK